MTALAEEYLDMETHTIVPAEQFHYGRVTTYQVQIQQLNKAIRKKNRRIEKLRRIELENANLNRQLKLARGLLDIHGIEWK